MAGQAETVEIPKRLPLVNRLQSRSPIQLSPFNKVITTDARIINGYAEFDPEDKEYWIYKRPGLSTVPVYGQNVGFGGSRGLYQPTVLYNGLASVLGTVLAVYGSALYQGNTLISSALDNTGPNIQFSFQTIGSNPPAVALISPFGQYLYTPSTSTFQVISPPNTDPLARGSAYLDSTLYVMDVDGNIWGSALLDPTTWDPLNVIRANSSGDAGVALAMQLNYVVALKQNSTQIFYDADNAAPGSPLSPLADSQIPLGCYSGDSVKSIDNSLLWITANETVSPQVVQMDNLVPKIVSTPAVDRILQNISFNPGVTVPGGGLYAWVLKIGGHRFYGISSTTLNVSLVYDLDQLLWYFWTDAVGNYWPVANMSYQNPPGGTNAGVHLAQHPTNGQVYQLQLADVFPNDSGVIVPVDIYTPNFDAGIDRKKQLDVMRFNADQTPGSSLQVRYNDNDFALNKWSNFRKVDLSKQRPTLTQNGSFYRRAYHMRHRCNTTLRIKTVDLQMGIGTL